MASRAKKRRRTLRIEITIGTRRAGRSHRTDQASREYNIIEQHRTTQNSIEQQESYKWNKSSKHDNIEQHRITQNIIEYHRKAQDGIEQHEQY